MKTVDQLLFEYNCKEIANCPGRYLVKDVAEDLSINQLLSDDVSIRYHTSPKAVDKIAVVALDGGGLISYIRSDGTILHTLNNESGFLRKLQQLEID